ncbi:jg6235 [Pararge aegeria aegeria]|uniref:Jg6235 protein n=1 Tax=Pararge aegeria aegeria TaxID=348720 RepID=A0A8S4RCE7_9NEOP|nr:jg6235 [Pararge aegeria aegeria]
MVSGIPSSKNRAKLHRVCKEHVLQHAALFPSTLGAVVKPHEPVITKATTPFRPEHSIATMLFSGRNKHGDRTSPDESVSAEGTK